MPVAKKAKTAKRKRYVIAGVDVRKVAKEPVKEQLELIDTLYDQIHDSVNDGVPPITPELAAFLDERLAQSELPTNKTYTWEEVVEHCHRSKP